jgi:small subunit ribosomal protein S13
MFRVANCDIPTYKRGEVALTRVFGIGISSSNKILKALSIDPNLKVEKWTNDQKKKVIDYISKNYQVGDDLKGKIESDIKRLKDINCYRGNRLRKGLPSRGQRTRTNSRTARKRLKGKLEVFSFDKKKIKK